MHAWFNDKPFEVFYKRLTIVYLIQKEFFSNSKLLNLHVVWRKGMFK
jgi:hypothetical protein